MKVKIWLCVDDKDKDIKKLPLLGEYNDVKTLGEAFKQARKQFPHYKQHSFIGKSVD